jgi:hypothetical protein
MEARMTRINVYTAADEYEGPALAGWFDPDSADKIEGRREWDGQNMADVHVGANRGQILYRTKGGRWVLHNWSSWTNEADSYQFIGDEGAKQWLLINESDAEVERWFGEIEEEKGPGRPEVGPATNVRLGDDLTGKVDAARIEGESRAAAIRRLLADALA